MKLYFVTNIFDIQIFDNGTRPPQTFLKLSRKSFFFSLFSLSERNVTIPLLMIHLKCTIVNYADQISSSISIRFYIRGRRLYYFVFLFLIYVCFILAFVNLIKKLSFLIQISKIHFKI